MPTMKLTAAFIERAAVEFGKDRTTYWDKGIPGFGLRVTKDGHRSFVVQYRAGIGRNGTDRRMTLDGVLKLDDARREAKAILGRVAKGEDPLDKRRKEAAKATGTLKAICERYLTIEGGMTRDADGKPAFSGKLRSA